MYLDGTDATLLPPGDRDVAMVFQSYALYPHMKVRQHRVSAENDPHTGRSWRAPCARLRHACASITARATPGPALRWPAAALRPGARDREQTGPLLLDEPLSNLDAKLRVETRVELKRLQRSLDVTAIYVTHDQEEAMSLSDRMAVFMDGRIVQVGTPEEVFSRPASVEVAAFLGNPPMNLLPARLDDGRVVVVGREIRAAELAPLRAREGNPRYSPSDLAIGGEGYPPASRYASFSRRPDRRSSVRRAVRRARSRDGGASRKAGKFM